MPKDYYKEEGILSVHVNIIHVADCDEKGKSKGKEKLVEIKANSHVEAFVGQKFQERHEKKRILKRRLRTQDIIAKKCISHRSNEKRI